MCTDFHRSAGSSADGSRLPVIDLGSTWAFTYMTRSGTKNPQQQQQQQQQQGEPSSLGSSFSATGGTSALSSQYENAIHHIADISNVRIKNIYLSLITATRLKSSGPSTAT